MKQKNEKKNTSKVIIINSILLIACLLVCATLIGYLTIKNNKSTSDSSTMPSSSKQISKSNHRVKWVKQSNEIKFPILMYHAIHDMAPEEANNANLIVSPETFNTHIKALKKENYYFLTPEEAYKVLNENVLPNNNKKIIWLTFDDSLEDFYTQAYPILKKYKVKATNNVITGMTEQGLADHLTLDQMKEMHSNGIALQSHTVNHPDLSKETDNIATQEMEEADNYLDSNFNQDTIAIAYPAGRYSNNTLAIASQYYKLGVTTNEGLASKSDGLLSLNRVRILPTTTSESLLSQISN